MVVMIYSGIFSASTEDHPIDCVYMQMTGNPCITCGLSRGFSEIVRGNIPAALKWNALSLDIFLFFLIQFLLRITSSILLWKSRIKESLILYIDIPITIGLFVYCFRGIILAF